MNWVTKPGCQDHHPKALANQNSSLVWGQPFSLKYYSELMSYFYLKKNIYVFSSFVHQIDLETVAISIDCDLEV